MKIIRKAAAILAMLAGVATGGVAISTVATVATAPVAGAQVLTITKEIPDCSYVGFFGGNRYVFDCGIMYTPQAGYHIVIDHYTDGMMHHNIDKYPAGGGYVANVHEGWNKDRVLGSFSASHGGTAQPGVGTFTVEYIPNYGLNPTTNAQNNQWNCITCAGSWATFFQNRQAGGPMVEVAPSLIDSGTMWSWDWYAASTFNAAVHQAWCRTIPVNPGGAYCNPAGRRTSNGISPFVGEARVRARVSQMIGWGAGVAMTSQTDYGDSGYWSFD